MAENRRNFFSQIASLTAGVWAGSKAAAQQQQESHAGHTIPAAGQPGRGEQTVARGSTQPSDSKPQRGSAGNIPVETPDVPKLPYKLVDDVKEFHLIAEVVRTELLPGRVVDVWGFNGSVPGPTIEVNQGDRVRVIFENRLPEMTSIHWHGFEIPPEMDGAPGLEQDPVLPGSQFVYEFTLHQHGTFFYHSHFAMQEMMGMIGLFIMHPKEPYRPKVDRDFGLILQEWALLPNNTVPNTLSMEFNWLTINGKAGPATTPMIVRQGERVRIRMVNLGMDHHPMHVHGNTFVVTGHEGGRAPESTWIPQNTVLVGVAQARDIEFDAKYIGDWMVHCHLPHHMMNQMVSMVGRISHGGGSGLHTGGGMQEGMGMVRQGNALSEELGPTLGRGLGVSADMERSTSNLVGADVAQVTKPQKQVPGYPQDMWMPMDEMFAGKPENYGLRKGWSGAMMGMMTLVRVVTPEMYDKIVDLKQKQPQGKEAKPDVQQHMHQHQHGK